MVRWFVLVLLAASLVGCASPSKSLQSWVGHNSNELIASWGPPSEVFADGNGGQVFVYAKTREWTQPGSATTTYSSNTYGSIYGNSYSGNTYGQAQTVYTPAMVEGYTAYRMFWIDSSGTIYSWAWRGL